MKESNEGVIRKIEIQEAKPEDARGIASVQRAAWLVTYPNEIVGVTREDVEDRFANIEAKISKWEATLAQGNEAAQTLVAKFGEEVVGFCVVKKEEKENNLSAIYVHPDYQNRGIGRKLYQNALEWLGTGKDISVFVADYNTQAIEFYQKLGFEDSGERIIDEKFRLKSGAIIPEMKMVLKAKE